MSWQIDKKWSYVAIDELKLLDSFIHVEPIDERQHVDREMSHGHS